MLRYSFSAFCNKYKLSSASAKDGSIHLKTFCFLSLPLVHNLIHHVDVRFRPVEYGQQVAVHPFGIDVFGQGEVAVRAGAKVAVQGKFKVGVSMLGGQERA